MKLFENQKLLNVLEHFQNEANRLFVTEEKKWGKKKKHLN